jgi:hypothetical protein
MSPSLLHCPKCRTPLTAFQGFNQGDFRPCPYCDAPLRIEIFPAFFRPIAAGAQAEELMVEGEASCFYHPLKKAVRPCDGCGRFLCALCDCELHGDHFCPACVESGGKKGRIKSLQNERLRHDRLALSLAIISFPLLITAPIAIFFAIRAFKAPVSLVVPSKTRSIVALVLATIALIGWIVTIVLINIS